jgi:hypothetical protein
MTRTQPPSLARHNSHFQSSFCSLRNYSAAQVQTYVGLSEWNLRFANVLAFVATFCLTVRT